MTPIRTPAADNGKIKFSPFCLTSAGFFRSFANSRFYNRPQERSLRRRECRQSRSPPVTQSRGFFAAFLCSTKSRSRFGSGRCDRLTLQHRSGQEVSACHRHAPPLRRRRPPTGAWPTGRAPSCARRGSSPGALRNRTACRVGTGREVVVPVPAGFSSCSSWSLVGSSRKLCLKPRSVSRECRSTSADTDTRGAPSFIPAQATGSSIRAAATMTTLGAVSR
jgi:hypothetical protein